MREPQTPEKFRFAVMATDCALFSLKDNALYLRVIPVNRLPYPIGSKAMPGGLIEPNETAEEAMQRLLKDRAHISASSLHMEQLFTFSDIERDPRGRVVSVAYLGLVPWETLKEEERVDGKDALWIPVSEAKRLAYDHDLILETALTRLRSKVTYTTLIKELMPREFTLTELETAYASVLKRKFDKRNFRKKILKLKILKSLNKKRKAGRSRPAALYSFASRTVQEIGTL